MSRKREKKIDDEFFLIYKLNRNFLVDSAIIVMEFNFAITTIWETIARIVKFNLLPKTDAY